MRVKISKQPYICAIDPGKSGGLAFGRFKNSLRCAPMPATVHDLAAVIKSLAIDAVYIEKVHTSPQMGVVSAGTFMKGVGQIEGICAALKLPFHEVTPQKWMKYFELGKAKKRKTKKGKEVRDDTEWKNRLKARAQKLIPSINITLSTADAVLLWVYAKENHKV